MFFRLFLRRTDLLAKSFDECDTFPYVFKNHLAIGKEGILIISKVLYFII